MNRPEIINQKSSITILIGHSTSQNQLLLINDRLAVAVPQNMSLWVLGLPSYPAAGWAMEPIGSESVGGAGPQDAQPAMHTL